MKDSLVLEVVKSMAARVRQKVNIQVSKELLAKAKLYRDKAEGEPEMARVSMHREVAVCLEELAMGHALDAENAGKEAAHENS